jgi:hypothetical protein
MKKLIYGGLFLAVVGIGVVGCKKVIQTSPENLINTVAYNTNASEVYFEKKGDVLVFENWEDVIKQEQLFEGMITAHVELFEKEHEEILRDLRVAVDRIPSKSSLSEAELTWESEIAVDSFEMAIGWSEFQPIIDFEQGNNFQSLRSKFNYLLYSDAENDEPSKLTDEERIYFKTFPIRNAMAAMFNENAIIGIGDSLYKVLGNNVWISCTFEKKSTLESLNESNYRTVIGMNGFNVYDINSEKSGCYANVKQHHDITSKDNKYRIYGMMTVTNVPVANGRYIKGDTEAEMRNNKGKWKSRKTYCQVSGGATMRYGFQCWDVNDPGGPWEPQMTVNGVYNEFHHNKSSRVGRYRVNGVFRVKSGEYLSYHKAGTGSNALEFSMLLQ